MRKRKEAKKETEAKEQTEITEKTEAKERKEMNLVSFVLIFIIAAAFGYGLYRIIKRKGKCSCCCGSCPGCSGNRSGNPKDTRSRK